MDFIQKSKELVAEYTNGRIGSFDLVHVDKIQPKDVYVVWQVKALNNWKALLSTWLPDGMYYEVTYNGATGEYYFDAYSKEFNKAVKEGGNLYEHKSTNVNKQ